jgi:hypothetical protein
MKKFLGIIMIIGFTLFLLSCGGGGRGGGSNGSGGNSTGITLNGVIIVNAWLCESYSMCGLCVQLENTTTTNKSIALMYNAFDSTGKAIGITLIQGLVMPKTTSILNAPWVTPDGYPVDCNRIINFELDINKSIVY